jgi:hypothetical protein
MPGNGKTFARVSRYITMLELMFFFVKGWIFGVKAIEEF